MHLANSPTHDAIDVSALPSPPRSFSARLVASAQPEQVGMLRRHASALFAIWKFSTDEQESAALVINELLSNAVVHGGPRMELKLGLTCQKLDITVTDCGLPNTAPVCGRDDPDECGRGLEIVTALADNVHTEQLSEGWRIRARMTLTSSPGPAPDESPQLRKSAA
ncbi:ATP-binding protein [Streptomyces shenzhenensis]|uniref:ATP-binding protein n=1 Tax=Streptomyces shenzhenensis TaxID=943815 RepID=UPI003406213B